MMVREIKNTWICSNCKVDISETDRFCKNCGEPVDGGIISDNPVEKREEKSKSNNNPNLFMILIIVIGVLIVYSMVNEFNNETVLGGGYSNQVVSSKFEMKFSNGVDNFNKGVNLLNMNQGESNYKTIIANMELAKQFFDNAKINFDSAANEKTSSNKIKRSKYLAESSDYYSKGIIEYAAATRMYENEFSETAMSGYAAENIANLLMGRGVDLSRLENANEMEIKMEKGKKYFELAKASFDSANDVSY